MAISTIRHESIINPRIDNPPFTIVGCGAVGSRIFMSLIELGMTRIRCIDFDYVEPHNLANQAFMHEHVGMNKGEALQFLYETKTGEPCPSTITAHIAHIPDPAIHLDGILFLIVDSFASRREIIESLTAPLPYYVIDTRMASTHGNAIGFSPSDPQQVEAYLATLGDDDTAEQSACGTSITVGPTASIIANLAVWHAINFIVDPGANDPWLEVFTKPAMLTTKPRL